MKTKAIPLLRLVVVKNIGVERYEICFKRYNCSILLIIFYLCIGFVHNYHFVLYFGVISFNMVKYIS